MFKVKWASLVKTLSHTTQHQFKMEKNQKHQVHNLIILDESGSMESIKDTIIQGFNEIVQTIKD